MKAFCRHIIVTSFSAFLFTSCIFDNDMSYPYIKGEIMSFEVAGQKSVAIDPKARTVSVELEEIADISGLDVIGIRLNDEARFAEPFPECISLESPYRVLVRTYQDYYWTISAVQPIERYVTCSMAAKKPLFNQDSRTVAVFLLPEADLKSVVIEDMKLEKEGAELVSTTGYELVDGVPVEKTETLDENSFPLTLDCTLERTFTFMVGEKLVEWKLSAVRQKGELKVDSVYPWCWSADVHAEFEGGGTPYISYRKISEESWTDVHEVEINGVSVSAKLTSLEQETEYTVKICTDMGESAEYTFRTFAPVQLDNMGFDDWYQNAKGTWYPGIQDQGRTWDTANGGAELLRKNPTVPEMTLLATGGGNRAAARLESMSVGMFAAGNIYTGQFLKASLSGAIGAVLNWGTPFTSRPKAIRGYYAYAPKVVDKAKKPYEHLMGTTDKCQILVLLTDWDEPFTVNTSEGIFVDQDNDPHIIAYKRFESDEQTAGYVPFEFELEYRRPDATPKYAVVIACSSYKGDFFTGAVGSVMYVDEFEFVYE